MEQDIAIFDDTAGRFASRIDQQISSRRYSRGDLFLSAALSTVPANGHILDYGCGPGRISALLGRNGFRVLGMDLSPGMIATARQQPLGDLPVEFEVCTSLPAEAQQGKFDAVVCSSVIEYVPDPADLLRSFFAALRPSGVLIISFSNRYCLSRALIKMRLQNPHLSAQKHMWSAQQFSGLLERSGFRTIRRVVYFDSIFDRFDPLQFVSSSRVVGTLGLAIAVSGTQAPSVG